MSPPAQAVHTPFSRGLLLLALGTGASGLALGNTVLLLLAGTIAALLHAARAGWPGRGTLGLEVAAGRVARGQTVEVGLPAQAEGSGALYLLHLKLPPELSVERGANLTLVEPGAATREALTLGCPKRGPHPVGPATLTALHPHLLAPAVEVARAPPADLVVEPRIAQLRRAKQLRGRARHRIGEDRGWRGPGGSDFREVREYERGDPLRSVNWKATAKHSLGGDIQLMVNTFEPEARKNVWFFLDLGPRMEVGTSLDNALEDAIEAAMALCHHFLARGHRVGGTTFNATPLVFYPENGARQELTIARALARAQAGHEEEGLPAAVERVRGFLVRERPTVFILTRPELDPQGLTQGVRRIQGYAGGKRPMPVYVLAPQPPAASPEEELAQALHSLEVRASLGGGALRVVPLREGVHSLHAALARGVLNR